MTVRKIDYPNAGGGGTGENPRVESGAVQFGEDWPGLFLRGDHCMELVMHIKRMTEHPPDPDDDMLLLAYSYFKGLGETIEENVLS